MEAFNYDKKVFEMIKFQYIYLPNIPTGREKDLLEYSEYSYNFEQILDILNKENNYNSVSSLMDYIDMFNEAINGNTIFIGIKQLVD